MVSWYWLDYLIKYNIFYQVKELTSRIMIGPKKRLYQGIALSTQKLDSVPGQEKAFDILKMNNIPRKNKPYILALEFIIGSCIGIIAYLYIKENYSMASVVTKHTITFISTICSIIGFSIIIINYIFYYKNKR